MIDSFQGENKILFVDDEINILNSYKRTLRPHFSVSTALGGKEALRIMDEEGPFSVIVSDIKMPQMDGIELLSKIRTNYPDSIRMVLTGFADLEIAIGAVNHGDIFRFLTKPCQTEDLIKAVKAGVEQYRLVHASRELEAVRRIKEGLEGTIRAFTRVVELRDPYTAGHMDRTADIAVKIADSLGLDSDKIQGLHLAALVHDIGKVAVPSGILNKPGPLTKAEFSIIKTHPLVGAEIFETMETEWPIQRIILEHHERIDGSGYPYGLKNDEILLESKIVAVADFIDATTTDRPYRQSMVNSEVISKLKKNSDTKLDRRCADIGIKLLQKGVIGGKPE
ncbi:MAG: hypothetical protein BA863_08750 [Desulfovibrio sp. S3730MH75]|nr:MAG: hypothetical protein BA863_08750 [Desulfovibrio sp. S3730MH75]